MLAQMHISYLDYLEMTPQFTEKLISFHLEIQEKQRKEQEKEMKKAK